MGRAEAAYERRAFGANRFVQVETWTNVPGFSGRAVLCEAAHQGRAISKSPPTAVCKPPLLGQKADRVVPDFNVTVHWSV
jgi:hypothetical protein